MLLGDASLSKPPNGVNYHLSIYHSQKQVEYLGWKDEFLRPYSKGIRPCAYLDRRDGKIRTGGRIHTISHPWLTELRRILYPRGRKTITSKFLHRIHHPVALAFLVGDDGSRQKSGVAIATKQFSEKENFLLLRWLAETFCLAGYLLRGKYVSVAISARSQKHLRQLVLPWLPKSLWYKLGGEHWRPCARWVGVVVKNCHQCGGSFPSYEKERRRYCSRSCANAAKIGRPGFWRGKRRPEMRHPGKYLFQKKSGDSALPTA